MMHSWMPWTRSVDAPQPLPFKIAIDERPKSETLAAASAAYPRNIQRANDWPDNPGLHGLSAIF